MIRLQRSGARQKQGADISYVWTREGWLYLAVVIDLFARRVVGWAAGDRLHKELQRCYPLRRAVAVQCPSVGGSFTTRTVAANTAPSGTRLREERHLDLDVGQGNCFGNAMVETFFKTSRPNSSWRTIFQSRIEAAIAIGRYIDGFYNPSAAIRRSTSSSPLQFEGRAV